MAETKNTWKYISLKEQLL